MNQKFLNLTVAAVAFIAGGTLLSRADDGKLNVEVLSTDHSSIAFTTGHEDGKVNYQYFGSRIEASEVEGLLSSGANLNLDTYMSFGVGDTDTKALIVKMPDGSISAVLRLQDIERTSDAKTETLVFTFKDTYYPLTVKQYFRAYKGSDVFGTWVELINGGKEEIELLSYPSVCMPVYKNDNYVTHLHDFGGAECSMEESPVPFGQMVIGSNETMHHARRAQPGFMISIDGAPRENTGHVVGGYLVYPGDHRTTINRNNDDLYVISGINPERSAYWLKGGETFETPEFLTTYSTEGKGGVSRAFHRWALQGGMHGGDSTRDILLNSWEGCSMDINQKIMEKMMEDIHQLGGELMVMDDGWFGVKYPRDTDVQGLGDWQPNPKKLPKGVKGLTEAAKRHGVKFGIWIEPEMVNIGSELYEQHPDWVLSQPTRQQIYGRGETQMILDLCRPEVQDFVFGVVDSLMTNNPEIAYIKWDCNANIMNYGSPYLAADRQSELPVRFSKGLESVLKRIRAKYPDVVLQSCAGGGGRSDYGMLRYCDEFWPSDDTEAVQRIFIQWGGSQFYPAQAMAAHVSCSPSQHTQRVIPLKFRFDVAMTGRLGLELQPQEMTQEEREYAARCIEAYKGIRQTVQQGDLYRLRSPYDQGGLSSLMYASPDKSEAVVFVHRFEHRLGNNIPAVKLDGVDENRMYLITDLTPENPAEPCYLDGQVVSGKVLKNVGLNVQRLCDRPLTSAALKLTAQ